MALRASNRRGNQELWPWRGDTSVTLAHPSNALRRGEPRLGRGFERGERNAKHVEQPLDVKSTLVGKLGPRGYGRLLQRLEKVTATASAAHTMTLSRGYRAGETAPKSRSQRRRPKAAA